MMTPVAPPDPGAQRRPARAGQRHGLGHAAGADRAADRPAARRLHHHLHLLALDLPDQHADRPRRHRAGDASSSRTCGRRRPTRSTRSAWCWPASASAGSLSAARVLGLNFLPTGVVIALIVVGAVATFAYVRHARRTPAPVLDLVAARDPDHARRRGRRLHLPLRHRRDAVPAAAAAAARLRPHGVPVRPDHALERRRRHGHEDGHPHHPAAVRLPPRAGGERADQRGAGRRLRRPSRRACHSPGSSACWSSAASSARSNSPASTPSPMPTSTTAA